MRLGPRVGRGALQRQVERNLEALIACGRDEVVEVVDGAQPGMDRVVSTLVTSDRPRRAAVPGGRGHGVVLALAVHLADGMNRGQVDDVEAHLRDPGEGLGRGGERAVYGVSLAVPTARGPGEHLVPCAEPS